MERAVSDETKQDTEERVTAAPDREPEAARGGAQAAASGEAGAARGGAQAAASGGAEAATSGETQAAASGEAQAAASGEAEPAKGEKAAASAETEAEPDRRARDQEARPQPARDRRPGRGGGDRLVALRKLVELAAKYPEVGPPLAELSFAIGEAEIGNQLVRLGTDREQPHIEYWFVAANAARREKRFDDVLRAVIDAVHAVATRPDEALAPGDEDRLLHLVRIGFATIMFDLRQLDRDSDFVRAMTEHLPAIESRLGKNAFYRTLLAQTLWFSDREASEREWDRADELGDDETTWNARGTWYNEAERDLDKAEKAYRRGLEKARGSALLMHNLAQILVEKARRPGIAPESAHRLLNQATEQLRLALRQDAPRLRRHIHATRDRLEDLRRALPQPERRGGAPRQGRPRDARGPGGGRPQGRPGGGPPPAGRAPAQGGGRQDHGRGERRRPEKFLSEGTVSLGEMILAKLKEKER